MFFRRRSLNAQGHRAARGHRLQPLPSGVIADPQCHEFMRSCAAPVSRHNLLIRETCRDLENWNSSLQINSYHSFLSNGIDQ